MLVFRGTARYGVVILLALAACGHHSGPAPEDVLTCTSLNAAVGATPGLEPWERDQVMGYAHVAKDPRLRQATTITAVARACDAMQLGPNDIKQPSP